MENFLTVVFWILTGLLCAQYAKKRGRDPWAWLFIGMFLGLLGLILLFILPVKKEKDKPQEPVVINVTPLTTVEVEKLWYYLDPDNKQFGPMSFHALKSAWHEGTVTLSTYVWNENMENWKLLKDVAEIQDPAT